MDTVQRSFLTPTTCFTIACVAFSVLAISSIWRNPTSNPTVTVTPPNDSSIRPQNKRRNAVDSLYGETFSGSPLATVSQLLCRCANASRNMQGGGDRSAINITLTSEITLLTTMLCRLQQALAVNDACITTNNGIEACYLASMSGLGSTMTLFEASIEKETAGFAATTTHELIQQLRNHRPGLEFLINAASNNQLPPTPPADDMTHSTTFHEDLKPMPQPQTGLTPSADLKSWIEPPPEYSVTTPVDIIEKPDAKESSPSSSETSSEAIETNSSTSQVHEAITNNDPETLLYLLTNDADPNTPHGDLQRSPLHLAAHLNHTTCLPILLRHGAILSTEDAAGDTPLHLAAWSGHVEALSTLLAHGAEVDWLSGRDGYSPLWCAISAYEIDAARLLLRHGARVSLRSASGGGLLPLHQAAVTGQSAMCELLLERGAQVDVGDDTGNTALHYAAASGSVASVRALVQAGASVARETTHGLTPLHWAAHKGHTEAAGVLVSCGADVDAKANEGATPLHMAANRGHLPAMRLLLASGADRNVEAEAWDGGSGRAADMARLKGHQRVASVLSE